jgi:aspartate aminotransferase
LKPSATVALNELSNQLIKAGHTVHKLGLGQSPFPVPEEVVAALRANAGCKDYLAVRGLQELREAVAGYHRRVDHVALDASGILIGPGSKELMFLLQLAFYGDLLVPVPCWVSYAPQARILNRQVHFIPTRFEEGWRLLPERLDALCAADRGRPRILILNYPGNPDGNSYGAAELEALAAVARDHGVILLSDEIYGPLYHESPHVSVARFYPEGTIISSGLSKWCGAGGWRLGTFAFPAALRWLLDAMASVASETYTSTAAPIQWAAITAFNGSTAIDEYLLHARRILSALGKHCARELRAVGAGVDDPKGAFYLFPEFSSLRERLALRGIHGCRELCQRALAETGVAFLPGEDFGIKGKRLAVRLAYVDFDGALALQASRAVDIERRLDETFLSTHCRSVVEGIDKLCDWLRT